MRQPPVIRYALILGLVAIIAVVVGSLVGQKTENPQPSGASSPLPGASAGPTPRY